MSSNDRTHPAVQMPGERHLLRGSFCMHIDKDYFRLLPDFAHRPIGGLERAVYRLHVGAALQVKDSDLPFSPEVVNDVAVTAVLARIVEGAEDTLLLQEQVTHMPSIPEVVPRRDDMHAETEQFFRVVLRQTLSFCQVLSVCNAKIDLEFLKVILEEGRRELEAGLTNNIADEEDIQ